MTNRWFSIAALLTSLSLVIIGCAGPSPTPTLSRLVSERLIAQGDYSSVTVSPDCRHVAGVGETKSKSFFVVDGIKGKEYDRMELGKLFSPDGQRVAYAAEEGDKWFAVVDGIEDKKYDSVNSITFSPDSKRVAYTAKEGDKWFAVVDGVEGNKYDDISWDRGGFILFSPDSNRVAYMAQEGHKQFVVVDGVEGKKYGSIYSLTFSPDSKYLAYQARRSGKWCVVVDRVEGKLYDDGKLSLPTVVFDSPDTLHYIAQKGNAFYLVEETIQEITAK